ncbi:replication initiator protein A [Staphylococcus pseudintermedius]|nr:replication initiator protein A [Staphylococcus pseudintermedius]
MSEHRFNIQQQYREKFYQLPKVFFTNDKYMQLSNDAKIAYALLKDRLELSIKNNWFDENGDIFFIFTNEKLKIILNCHDGKLTKIKKELSKADLLEQVRCGQGKPNKLYLKNPVVTKEDVYEIKKQEEISIEPSSDTEMRKSHFKKCENRTSRNAKIALQEMRKSHTNDTDFSDTDFSDTDFSDTTTKNKEQSGSSIKNIIESEFDIKLTERYMNKILNLSKDMEKDLLLYAVNYASENGNFPKQYLLKILQIWKENNISSKNQVEKFKINSNGKSFNNREKEPRWITHPEEYKSKEEDQQRLEEDVKAFKEYLSKKQRYSN